MGTGLTIGKVAERTGLSAKTIRFYEDEGVLPRPRRSDSGYRLYDDSHLHRLEFVRRARLLGIELPAIKALLAKATAAECAAFGEELLALLDARQREVEKRLRDLALLRDDLEQIKQHVAHCCEGCDPSVTALECSYCCLMDEEERR